MSPAAIAAVRRLEAASLADMPQIDLPVDHVLHAGLYSRTVTIPAGVLITGVEVKIPTLLVVVGSVDVFVGGAQPLRLRGHNIVAAEAGRKQAFVAHTETRLTMIFPTQAKTVAEAEAEFTDETHMLQTRSAECQA